MFTFSFHEHSSNATYFTNDKILKKNILNALNFSSKYSFHAATQSPTQTHTLKLILMNMKKVDKKHIFKNDEILV